MDAVNTTVITLDASVGRLALLILVSTLIYTGASIIGKLLEYRTAKIYASLAKDLSETVSLELLAKSLNKLAKQFEDTKINTVADWTKKHGVVGAARKLMSKKNFNRVEINKWFTILLILLICMAIMSVAGG